MLNRFPLRVESFCTAKGQLAHRLTCNACRTTTVMLIFVLHGTLVQAADLRMRVVWEGPLPDIPKITSPFKHDCQDIDLNADRQFIDAKTGGIRDVVVYVSPLRRDRDRWRQKPRNKTIPLQVTDCRIHPHIILAQAGDKLRVVCDDESASHNLNFSFFSNPALGAHTPLDGEYTIALRSAEPAAVPIECNVHSWERAYVFVLDHHYTDVSDREGHLFIRDLPVETTIPLRLFHSRGSIYSVRINGVRKELKNGRLNIRVGRGVTEFGDIVLDTRSFIKSKSRFE